ncbi:MAG: DUF4433 domain-containing protein [Promethearchaeota archaeon]
MSREYHPEYKEMKEILNQNEITEVYHFTSINNIPSIFNEGGLLSVNELRNRGLENLVDYGGNILSRSLNGSHETLDYIKLSFRKKQPMAYHVEQNKHIVVLIIDPEIILIDGVLLSNENSTASNCIIDNGVNGLLMIDFESIKDDVAWRDSKKKKSIQAEILVPNRIDLEMIKKICCISESSLEETKRLCDNFDHPPICIDSSHFFAVARGFIHTIDSFLTNELITRENVNSGKFSRKTTFSIKSDNQITLLVDVRAIPNLECEFIWKDEFNNEIQKTSIDQFDSSNEYFIWDVLRKDNMTCGNFMVSFYLNEIRQFTIPFEILEE